MKSKYGITTTCNIIQEYCPRFGRAFLILATRLPLTMIFEQGYKYNVSLVTGIIITINRVTFYLISNLLPLCANIIAKK